MTPSPPPDRTPAAPRIAAPREKAGILLVAAAAVLWSTSGLFAKAPIFAGWDAASQTILMAFWRAVFASAVIILLVRRPRWSWRLVPMMVCFVGMSWSFLRALVETESTTAIWLQYTAPVYVLLFGVLVLKEVVRRNDVWFLAISMSGLAIILAGQAGRASTAGLLFGLLAGVFYAGVILTLRQLRDFEPAWLVLLNQIATALFFLPFCLGLEASPSGTQWLYLAGFGVLQLGLPYLLFARGVRHIPGHQASLVALLEPLMVPFWVFLVWRHAAGYEPPRVTTLLGGGLILASLIIRYGSALSLIRPGKLSTGTRGDR